MVLTCRVNMDFNVGWSITDDSGGSFDTFNPRSAPRLLSLGISTEPFSLGNRESRLTINGTMSSNGITMVYSF